MTDKRNFQRPFKDVSHSFYPGYAYGIREKVAMYCFSADLQFMKRNVPPFASNVAQSNNNELEELISVLFDRLILSFQEIQRNNRIPVFSRPVCTFKKTTKGELRMVYALPYWTANILKMMVSMTFEFLNALAYKNVAYDLWEGKIDDFFSVQLSSKLMPVRNSKFSNSFAMMESAFKKKIEISFLHERTEVLQLGYSDSAPWIRSTHTSSTPFLSVSISKDKFSTNRMLRSQGFPVCRQAVLTNINQLKSACQKIGFPLVVKPVDCDGGVGISSNLIDIESVEKAYRIALKESNIVLLENYVSGDNVRIIFFNGRLLKCFKRKKQGVVGDGKLSIRDLVNQKNALVRKKSMRLEIDDVTHRLLEQQGLSLKSIPGHGEYVKLGELHNVSAGGIMFPLSVGEIHPDNVKLAKKAVEILRLDFAGVDMIVDDISKSWRETNLVITEINSAPQIGSEDKAIFDKIIDILTENCVTPVVDCVIALDSDEAKKLAGKHDLMEGVAVVFNGQVVTLGEMIVKQFQNSFIAVRAAAQQLGAVRILLYMTVEEVETMSLPFISFNNIVLSDAVRLSNKSRSMSQVIGQSLS